MANIPIETKQQNKEMNTIPTMMARWEETQWWHDKELTQTSLGL